MITTRAGYISRWSELHGGARPSRIVGGWLSVAYLLARPLALLRIAPDAVSLAGVTAAALALAIAADRPIAAAMIILASLILDGLDGAVAMLRERESAWGAVLDGFLDRLGEALWAVALVAVGVPVWLATVGWVLAMVQEYQRARLAALHSAGRPISVSICERPVRALLIASAVAMSDAALPLSEQLTPTVFASAWLGLQAIGVMQVWRSASILHRES